jgi:hypothetical protein
MITGDFIAEPLLEFGYTQQAEHPQDGLFLYGPVKIKGTPEVLNVGVVGTRAGNELLKKWLRKLSGRIAAEDAEVLHTSSWPGFEAALGQGWKRNRLRQSSSVTRQSKTQ